MSYDAEGRLTQITDGYNHRKFKYRPASGASPADGSRHLLEEVADKLDAQRSRYIYDPQSAKVIETYHFDGTGQINRYQYQYNFSSLLFAERNRYAAPEWANDLSIRIGHSPGAWRQSGRRTAFGHPGAERSDPGLARVVAEVRLCSRRCATPAVIRSGPLTSAGLSASTNTIRRLTSSFAGRSPPMAFPACPHVRRMWVTVRKRVGSGRRTTIPACVYRPKSACIVGARSRRQKQLSGRSTMHVGRCSRAVRLIRRSRWPFSINAADQTRLPLVCGSIVFAYCEPSDPDFSTSSCPRPGWLRWSDGPKPSNSDATNYLYFAADHPACASSPLSCAYRRGDLMRVTNAAGHETDHLNIRSGRTGVASFGPFARRPYGHDLQFCRPPPITDRSCQPGRIAQRGRFGRPHRLSALW
jgi:hypothetical protein